MSLNQRKRVHEACHQTSLHPTHHLNICSVNPTRWELVPEGVSLEQGTEEQLHHIQAELQRYRMLYENMPSVYLSLDVTGSILSVNQFGASFLGYQPEQIVKQPIFALFAQSEKQRLVNELTALLADKPKNAVNCGDLRLECPLSQLKWAKVTLRFVADDFSEPVILMVCEDVTAQVGHRESVIGDRKELPQSLGYKCMSMGEDGLENPVLIPEKRETTSLIHLHEEFISAVSHELRTPLTNMKMAIQMLGIALRKQQKLLEDADSSPVGCYLEILNNECDREINLINNFLDLKRLETNSQPWVLETIHIQEWLRQMLEKFKQRHVQLCQQHLSLNIAPSLPPLRSNPLNLERIFIELLTNACKFSPPDAAIIISAKLKANKILLQVTNSGVEIPSTELPRIFDKFYRIPSNDPAKQGGTGLGLALVQKLARQLGGTITAESGSNRTCFTLLVNIQ